MAWIELRETRGEIEEKRGNDERKRGRKSARWMGEFERHKEKERKKVGDGKREMETFRRDGTRGIYAVGCRRRVDCEPRSINNDTTASAIEVVYTLSGLVFSRSFQFNNLGKMEFALINQFHRTKDGNKKYRVEKILTGIFYYT